MTAPTVNIHNLGRSFGRQCALDDVSLQIRPGSVLGLVGENGAGKTTLVKHVLGLLKAQQGAVTVFGLNPVDHPTKVLGKIGYLSEDRDLPAWMRISELLAYTQAFYPDWDTRFADQLLEQFDLDPLQKIKTLSRGQKARVGLLTALAHRPELLLLDEPSSGLDPVVRQDILTAIIRTVADDGRTVLFSSHLLDEVERVADDVVMLHAGRVILSGPLEDLVGAHHCVVVRFAEPSLSAPQLTGALSSRGDGRTWSYCCNGQLEQLRAAALAAGGDILAEETPSFEDVFVSHVRAQSQQGVAQHGAQQQGAEQ